MTNSLIISFITSNWVLALVAGALAVWLVRWLKNMPEDWSHWTGLALKAVKAAEHAIPNDCKNKSLAKFDYAMRVFIGRWQDETGQIIDTSDMVEIENLLEQAVQMIDNKGEKKNEINPAATQE